MKSEKKKISIITGGTGGHVFPSLSLASFLKEEYNDEVDYWISEKDDGIYDAWNKGIKMNKNKVIFVLKLYSHISNISLCI